MRALPSLPRAWTSWDLAGYREDPNGGTYGQFSVDDLPPIERNLDAGFNWLLTEPPADDWAILNPAEFGSFEKKKSEVFGTQQLRFSSPFAAFIASPAPANRIRSITGCYLDVADHVVQATDGGTLVHFLSDQQWVVHWLVYVGPDGTEAVVSTYLPYGFDFPAEERHPDYDPSALVVFEPAKSDARVCSESFLEFIYRFWVENEISFRLGKEALTDEQKQYLEHYRPRHQPRR
jgi:hypothetical protein